MYIYNNVTQLRRGEYSVIIFQLYLHRAQQLLYYFIVNFVRYIHCRCLLKGLPSEFRAWVAVFYFG